MLQRYAVLTRQDIPRAGPDVLRELAGKCRTRNRERAMNSEVLGPRRMNGSAGWFAQWFSKREDNHAPPRGLEALAYPDKAFPALPTELKGILASSPISTQLQIYARCDGEAIDQQRRLMRELTIANVCLMIAGVLSGLVLAGGAMRDLLGGLWTDRLAWILGAATLVMGALAAMLTYWARESDRLRRWLGLRSRAEMARLNAFREFAAALGKVPGERAVEGLAIVREHLLDDQRDYLHARGVRHRRSSEWTSVWGGVATALAFVGGSGAIIASFVPSQSWIAVAGVVGAALAAYAANREGLRRDRANSDRCEKAVAALDEITARYDAVATEVREGRPEAIVAFTTAIADQLANEHRQWMEGTAQAELAVAKLNAQLEQLGPARDNPPPPPATNGAGAGGDTTRRF
jgi:hypothetical protein